MVIDNSKQQQHNTHSSSGVVGSYSLLGSTPLLSSYPKMSSLYSRVSTYITQHIYSTIYNKVYMPMCKGLLYRSISVVVYILPSRVRLSLFNYSMNQYKFFSDSLLNTLYYHYVIVYRNCGSATTERKSLLGWLKTTLGRC